MYSRVQQWMNHLWPALFRPARLFTRRDRLHMSYLTRHACCYAHLSTFKNYLKKTKESGRHSDKNVITDVYIVGTVKTHCVLIFFLCIRNDLVFKATVRHFWGKIGLLLSCQDCNEKIDTTLMSVHFNITLKPGDDWLSLKTQRGEEGARPQ